jgi:propanol-preferring alcohol dehydrogenase
MNTQVKAQTVVEFGAPLVERISRLPRPVDKQVLVRVKACGLCHSDLHFHEGYINLGSGNHLPLAALNMTPPLVLGHEAFGQIAGFGPNAGLTESDKGRLVIVYPWIGCGQCEYCKTGRHHQCQKPQAIGMQQPGGHADHLLVPDAKFLFDAAGVDPLLAGSYACSGLTAYSAIKKLRDICDDWIGIIGVGGVGMMALSIAKAIGHRKVAAIDVNDERLKLAVDTYGADLAINSSRPDAADRLRKTTGGLFGVADFVGSAETAAFAIDHLKQAGKLVIIGLFGGELKVPLPAIATRELNICGSFVGSLSEMAELMTYVRAGNIKPIPTEKIAIDNINQAFAQLRSGKVNGRLVLMHE